MRNTARFPVREGAIYCRGGKTGKKIHSGRPGSSMLDCGKWVRYELRHYRLSPTAVEVAGPERFCEKCWPKGGWLATADDTPTVRCAVCGSVGAAGAFHYPANDPENGPAHVRVAEEPR